MRDQIDSIGLERIQQENAVSRTYKTITEDLLAEKERICLEIRAKVFGVLLGNEIKWDKVEYIVYCIRNERNCVAWLKGL